MREAIRKRGGIRRGRGWRVIDSRPREIVNVLFGILGKEEEKEEEKKEEKEGVGWPVEGKRKREGVTRSLSLFPSQTLTLTRFPFRLAHIRTRTHTCGPAVPLGRGGGGPGPSFEHTHPHRHSFFFNKNFFVEKSEFNSFHPVLIHNGPKKSNDLSK